MPVWAIVFLLLGVVMVPSCRFLMLFSVALFCMVSNGQADVVLVFEPAAGDGAGEAPAPPPGLADQRAAAGREAGRRLGRPARSAR